MVIIGQFSENYRVSVNNKMASAVLSLNAFTFRYSITKIKHFIALIISGINLIFHVQISNFYNL